MLRPFALVLSALALILSAANLISFTLPANKSQLHEKLCGLLYVCDEAVEKTKAYQFMAQPKGGAAAVESFESSLRRSPADPDRWANLADAFLLVQDLPKARKCYERAVLLAPHIPAIQWRAANAAMRSGDVKKALDYMSQILREVTIYDATIFSYFDNIRLPVTDLLGIGVPNDRRAGQAYFQHLLLAGKTPEAEKTQAANAEKTWTWLVGHSLADETLARDYANQLLLQKHYPEAAAAWSRFVNRPGAGTDKGNLLYNGGFETAIGDKDLDWTSHPATQVQVARDHVVYYQGEWSLRVKFDASENLKYQGAAHKLLITPGRYRLAAYVRAEGITTEQGPRLRIFDLEEPARLDLTTESTTGTSDWKPVQLDFETSPKTRLVEIQVVRQASRNFDSQIKGTFWLDAVSVVPVTGPNSARTEAQPRVPRSKPAPSRSGRYTN